MKECVTTASDCAFAYVTYLTLLSHSHATFPIFVCILIYYIVHSRTILLYSTYSLATSAYVVVEAARPMMLPALSALMNRSAEIDRERERERERRRERSTFTPTLFDAKSD